MLVSTLIRDTVSIPLSLFPFFFLIPLAEDTFYNNLSCAIVILSVISRRAADIKVKTCLPRCIFVILSPSLYLSSPPLSPIILFLLTHFPLAILPSKHTAWANLAY